jgi:6-phosphogluconate dehydrogenase
MIMIYAIDTDEKLNWFLNALENEEIIIDGRNMTEEDHEQLSKDIAEYKANRQKKQTEEPVPV